MTMPIGPLISELRVDAGLSQSGLADRLNEITGKAHTRWDISRWENGRRIPVGDVPALAVALNVPEGVLEEAAEAARRLRGPRPAPADADSLAAVLESHRRLEDTAGAAAVLPAATAYERTLERTLTDARGPARRRFAVVAASSAQFAGWVQSMLRQYRHAGWYYDTSLRLALEADDSDAAATALSMHGHLAWLKHDPGSMIASTQAARKLARLPATRAITAQQEARGHALEGDERAALSLMDEAEGFYGNGSGDRPGSLYFYDKAQLRMQRGVVLHYLGRHQQAAELIASGLAGMPAEVAEAEWLNWYKAVLAEARAGRRRSPRRTR